MSKSKDKGKRENKKNKVEDGDSKGKSFRIEIEPRNDRQLEFLNAVSNPKNHIVFCQGAPGCGKSYLSLRKGLEGIVGSKEKRKYTKLVLIQPNVQVGGRDTIGFIPGTLEEKFEHVNASSFYEIDKCIGKDHRLKLIEKGKIEIVPINFIRGKNLSDCYILCDEFQNTQHIEFLTVISRIAEGSKMVILYDPEQVDIRQESAMIKAKRVFKGVEGFSFTEFEDCHIVRHPIIKKIVKLWREDDESEPIKTSF